MPGAVSLVETRMCFMAARGRAPRLAPARRARTGLEGPRNERAWHEDAIDDGGLAHVLPHLDDVPLANLIAIADELAVAQHDSIVNPKVVKSERANHKHILEADDVVTAHVRMDARAVRAAHESDVFQIDRSRPVIRDKESCRRGGGVRVDHRILDP